MKDIYAIIKSRDYNQTILLTILPYVLIVKDYDEKKRRYDIEEYLKNIANINYQANEKEFGKEPTYAYNYYKAALNNFKTNDNYVSFPNKDLVSLYPFETYNAKISQLKA